MNRNNNRYPRGDNRNNRYSSSVGDSGTQRRVNPDQNNSGYGYTNNGASRGLPRDMANNIGTGNRNSNIKGNNPYKAHNRNANRPITVSQNNPRTRSFQNKQKTSNTLYRLPEGYIPPKRVQQKPRQGTERRSVSAVGADNSLSNVSNAASGGAGFSQMRSGARYNVNRKTRAKTGKYNPFRMWIPRIAALLLIFITLIVLVSQCGNDTTPPVLRSFTISSIPGHDEPPESLNANDYAFQLGDEYSAESILMIDMETGSIMAYKNPDIELFPASLTKIMTAIIAIENIGDTEMLVTLDSDMFEYIDRQNASTAGFKAGEQVKIIDLLYGCLLSSGSECSIGLARAVATTESKFAALMNEKAAALGMEHTHYVNSTGLHDINQYSTASDTVKLIQYCLKNEVFRTIFTSKSWTTSPTSIRNQGILLVSTTFRAFTLAGYRNDYLLGGKTGYTNEAGLCLTTLANRNGREYLLCVFGCGDGSNETPYHVYDTANIYVAMTPIE